MGRAKCSPSSTRTGRPRYALYAAMARAKPARVCAVSRPKGMGATLRQLQLCADDITDPFWKNSYQTRNPSYVRAEKLAAELELTVP